MNRRLFVMLAAAVLSVAAARAESGFVDEAEAARWYAAYSREVFERENLAVAAETYWHPDFANALAPDVAPGIAGMRAQVEPFFAAFDDIVVDVESVVLSGENLVARVRIGATQVGPFLGHLAKGHRVEVREIAWYQVKARRLYRIWPAVDLAGLEAQLAAAEKSPQSR